MAVSPENLVVIGRICERLIATAGGVLSLYFGWQLFHSGSEKYQKATMELGGWKVNFSKVGPGVFFALFGMYILYSAITNKADVDTDEDSPESSNSVPGTNTAPQIQPKGQ
jgi:hypothetical protein